MQMHGYESGTGWTTGGDMLVWDCGRLFELLRMLLNGGELDGVRLLKAETFAQMATSQVPRAVLHRGDFPLGYSQGLAVHVLEDTTYSGGVGSVGEFSGGGGPTGTSLLGSILPKIWSAVLMVQIDAESFDFQRQIRAAVFHALDEGR